jgi:hypothetical protein
MGRKNQNPTPENSLSFQALIQKSLHGSEHAPQKPTCQPGLVLEVRTITSFSTSFLMYQKVNHRDKNCEKEAAERRRVSSCTILECVSRWGSSVANPDFHSRAQKTVKKHEMTKALCILGMVSVLLNQSGA